MNLKARQLLEAFENLPAGSIVVEIGCVRFPEERPSDGYSTVWLSWEAAKKGWTFHSVEIDRGAVDVAKELTGTPDFPVSIHQADGARWLTGFRGPIDGLYLDGAAEPQQAVDQYRAADLAEHAVIAVDDIQPVETENRRVFDRGKGDLLLDVLEEDGWTVEIHETEPDYLMAVAVR